ncbi:MAG TPA: hypothetical protein VLX68_00755 [Chitinivibrionales bacterium]|nr:hypothetical protein [Chitinivibrionales bacterium]
MKRAAWWHMPLTVLGIAVLWILLLGTQNKLTSFRANLWAPASMSLIPQSEKIKPYLLGFHTAYADYLWIRTTIYFGSHFITDKQYQWLVHMVDLVTKINPNFYPAYEFAGLMIPDICMDPDAARVILERGVSSTVENKWKLYFYLGMIYYKYGDKKTAAQYMARAVTQPNAPGYKLAGIAAAMFKKAGEPAEGRDFLEFVYTTSENPEVKRYIKGKLQAFSTSK